LLKPSVSLAGETDGVASKVAVKVPVCAAIALFTKPLLLVTVVPLPVLEELELEDLLLEDDELELLDFEELELLLDELVPCCEKSLKYWKSVVFSLL
jgi:hypothetical protein